MATVESPRTSGVTARPSVSVSVDRVAVLVDSEPVGERVGKRESGIVERAGEQVTQPARFGRVAQLDDQARDRHPRPPPPRPGQHHTERHRDQRSRLPEPEPLIDLVVGEKPAPEAVRIAAGDESEIHDGGEEHRRREQPRGGRRPGDPPDRERCESGGPDQAQQQARTLEPDAEVGRARDRDEIAWALRAALRGGVEDQRRQQSQYEDRPGVGDRQRNAFGAPREPAARVGERRVRHERRTGSRGQQPDREHHGRAHTRVVELDGEPGATRGDEERSDAARGPARPCDNTAGDQRPAGAQEHHARGDRATAERRAGTAARDGQRADAERETSDKNEPVAQLHAPHLLTPPRATHEGVPWPQRRTAAGQPRCAPRGHGLGFVEEWSVHLMWRSRGCLGPHAIAMRASGT